MVRESFQEQLNSVRHDILHMGNLVENAIELAVTALKRQDLDLAAKVVMDDEHIDQMELVVEKKCLSLLALQQPLARDLRFIGTALKMNTDLERMGDYACNIAKVVLALGHEPFVKPLVELPRMAELSQLMLRENLTAYLHEDQNQALEAARYDHEIDMLYNKLLNELLAFMCQDPKNVKQATYFLFIARHLERIGDHATNLSEWIIHMIAGQRIRLNEA